MDNSAISVFKNLSEIFSNDVHFSDLLSTIGVATISIYGFGDVGRIIFNDLNNHGDISIVDIYDKKTHISYQRMNESDELIIVTPCGLYDEIRDELVENGIDAKRLISVPQIIMMWKYLNNDSSLKYVANNNREFLIVGANFDNKGSEAMTFVTIKELKSRFRDCLIWFCPNYWDDIYLRNNYKMIILEDGRGKGSIFNELLPRLSAIIDVSGYAVSSEKGFGATSRTVDYLKKAYAYGIPYYFMPQSFGPIDYPKYKLAEMRELFSFAKIVYARELSGKRLLEEKLGLKNVKTCTDMVLQSTELRIQDVYISRSKKESDNYLEITGNVIVLVPNFNLLRYYSLNDLVEFYSKIIEHLLNYGKSVHIIPHSCDEEICEAIYCGYADNNQVILHTNMGDSFQFNKLIKNADFIISSRYHAIVQAYKLYKPCIAIGWAEKYIGLLSDVGQTQYLVDIREGIDAEMSIKIIDKLVANLSIEKRMIQNRIIEIQKDNCFSSFDDIED